MKRFSHSICRSLVVDALAIVTTSTMLTMMFPRVSWAALAWFALVPLFLQIRRSGYRKAAVSSLLVGFLFFICLMGWTLRL